MCQQTNVKLRVTIIVLAVDAVFANFIGMSVGIPSIKDCCDLQNLFFVQSTGEELQRITSHKQLVKGDVLIDDGTHNLEGGNYFKILMTAQHNKKYDAEANGMLRVETWAEVYSAITLLAEEDNLKGWKEVPMAITLYSTGCPKCKVLKKKLEEKGIKYTENNSVDEMLSLGISQVPVLSVNNKLLDFSTANDWVNQQ